MDPATVADDGSDRRQGRREHFGATREPRAIRGNFIPVSTSMKSRSPSPRRGHNTEGVLVQLSLTDSQMERLTAVTPRSSTRSRSPVKRSEATTFTPSQQRSYSPVKLSSSARTRDGRRVAYEFNDDTLPPTPTKNRENRRSKSIAGPVASPPTAARYHDKPLPNPSDIGTAQQQAKKNSGHRQGQGPANVEHRFANAVASPGEHAGHHMLSDDASSLYSQDFVLHEERKDEYAFRPISPLRIKKVNAAPHRSVLRDYSEWRNSPPRPNNNTGEPGQEGSNKASSSGTERMYSPLLMSDVFPPEGRKASKTLFGQNGWLENTSSPPETAGPSPRRKGTFLNNLVKKAKEMVESSDAKAQRRSREPEKSHQGNMARSLAISLTPREQSLLYCELEFVLTNAMNDYIGCQLNAGRLEADKLKRVSESWQQKGRPKVVGFRFDLETQLDLVRLHVNDFKFYGRHAAGPTTICGIIDMMKVNARALRIRTFCQPDTVIAKQLVDSQLLFNLLGCPEPQQIQLAEITDFYKAVMERERFTAKQREDQREEPQQQQQQRGSADTIKSAGGATTTALRHSKSQTQTNPGNKRHPATVTHHGAGVGLGIYDGSQAQQMRKSASQGAIKMDPSDYDSQEE
ncbi:hypothetical protein QBC46DRAFT_301811 [Diplogelasinospora grovesii]|uniref:Uncharacterized protein n=1 Tax=Diplogelasinospora grovesii TaxID=303347 RepID=A0AAN6NJU9_9PEZI|nr:hypothetical protein QBC46DRAFT_301811 [Diplogelasinospora grovesii]